MFSMCHKKQDNFQVFKLLLHYLFDILEEY